ncbi:MAG: hypothetical protein ACE364_07565 [Chlorobiota bacterium]
MKKLQIILLFAALVFTYSCSDNSTDNDDPPVNETGTIELIATDGLVIDALGTETEISYHTQIKSSSTRDMKVLAKMEVIELADDHWTYFCWGDISTGEGTCYEATKDDFLATFTLDLEAGQTTDPNSFINYIKNDVNANNTSQIRYIVYEEGNEANADTLEYTINVQFTF